MGKYYDIDPETCSLEELEKTIGDLELKEQQFNTMQLASKVFLNSVYGALGATFYNLAGLNINGCTTVDMASSITSQSRDIIQYSAREINEYFRNDWNKDVEAHKRIAKQMKEWYPDFDEEKFLHLAANNPLLFETLQVYGDSFVGDSIIHTNDGDFTVEELFNESFKEISYTGNLDDKIRVPSDRCVLNFNTKTYDFQYSKVKYIMRHKNTKKLYKINVLNKSVLCTEDHSLLALKYNGDEYVSITPRDLIDSDGQYLLCTCGNYKGKKIDIYDDKFTIQEIDTVYDYVYDIAIDTELPELHNVYANDILVHNTDSVDGNSLIYTKLHPEGIPISELYKENSSNPGETTLSGHESVHTTDEIANLSDSEALYKPVRRIIKHKVKKPKWRLKTASGKEILCTGDHSLVVVRNDNQIVVKPNEIIKGDKVIEIKK